MTRHTVAMILACLYVAGASWVVRDAGRAYRDSLPRPAPEAAAVPAPTVAPPSVAAVEERDSATPVPAGPRPLPPPIPSDPTPEATAPPGETARTARPSPGRSTPPPSAAVGSGPPPPPATPPVPGVLAGRLSEWRDDPFWNQPALTREWSLDHFTVQDEKQLGADLNRLILELNSEDPGSGLRRVKEVAEPLLELVRSKDREYRFFVLNSEVANAFSHPGGYVYVSRRLLEMIPEDETALLEFVLGHEMAHVELHHALACLNATDVRGFKDGTLRKLYFIIIPHGYPEEFESAADAWVYARMRRLGRTDHDCLNFLRLLDNHAKANGFENGRGKVEDLLKPRPGEPGGNPGISVIDNHLRSHPAAYERLRRLKALASAARK